MKKSNRFPKALASAVLVAAAFGATSTAHAGTIAQAILTLQNFTFYVDNGTNSTDRTTYTAVDASQLGSLDFNDNAQVSATLNGVNINTGIATNGFGGLDIAPAQLGGPAYANNDFTVHNAPTGTLSRSDSVLGGAPISGTAAPSVGATAITLAESSTLGPTNSALNQTDLGLIGTFTFVATSAFKIGVGFDASVWTYAFLQPGTVTPGSTTQASNSWSIELTNVSTGASVFKWTPDGEVVDSAASGRNEVLDGTNINTTVSDSIADANPRSSSGSGAFLAFATDNLIIGDQYEFNIIHKSSSKATEIPEPGTLALLGMGLGFAGLLRRRNQKSA